MTSPSATVKTMAASAAEEMGAVSARPKTTETMMPMGMGCSVVAISRKRCRAATALLMPGADQVAMKQPETMETMGTTMMSTLVLPETRLPSSAPTTAAK